jgi:ribosomal protein L4
LLPIDNVYFIDLIRIGYFYFQAARPLITVYGDKGETTKSNVTLPAVFRAPIRPDIVVFVHSQMRKNSRQPYAVSEKAGKIP